MKNIHWLSIILGIFILKGLFSVFLIPPWEAPDEPGHVAYVAYLYHERKVPSATSPFIPESIVQSFSKQRSLFEKTGKHILTADLFDTDDRTYNPISANIASHPPLYYLLLVPLYALFQSVSSGAVFYALRIGSLLLGVVALLLTYAIGKKLSGNITIALVSTFLVSMTPTFTFITGIVNNDIMVVCFFLASVYLLYNLFISPKISDRQLISIAVVVGLSPLSKPQLFILPPLFCLLLLRHVKKGRLVRILASGLSLIPTGLWFLSNYVREGSVFVSYAVQHIQTTHASPWSYPIEFVLGKQPIGIFMSFWGFFGWLDVPMPKWIYLFYAGCILLGLYGLRFYNRGDIKLYFLLGLIALYTSAIFAFDIYYYVLSHTFAIQGRYLTPVLPLMVIVIVQSYRLFPEKWSKPAMWFASCGFILGQILMFSTVLAYY